MKPLAPDYKRALYCALGVHLGIVVMMFLQIDLPWRDKKPALSYVMPNVEVVQAHLVSEADQKRAQEANKQKKAEAARLAEAEKQKKAEAARLVEVEKQKKIEAARLVEVEKQKKAVAETEKQKAAEALLAAEKKKQADAELTQAEQQRQQDELAKQQQLLAEQQVIDAAQQAQLQQALLSEVERYTLMVKQKVMQNWLLQRGFEGLSTQLHVRVAPSGTVLDVQIVSKSGNEALDRSAVSAVYRASPLPVPEDPAVFASFRELRLILSPEEMVTRN